MAVDLNTLMQTTATINIYQVVMSQKGYLRVSCSLAALGGE